MALSLDILPLRTESRIPVGDGEGFQSFSNRFDKISESANSTSVEGSKTEDCGGGGRGGEGGGGGGQATQRTLGGGTVLRSAKESAGIIAPTNTRNIGTLIVVQLEKEAVGGFGFSVTTRDNQTGSESPIYIRNILPKGAAFKSGKLRPGDRLIQIEETALTGASLNEATAIFRSTDVGSSIRIVVSRQQCVQDKEDVSPKEEKRTGGEESPVAADESSPESATNEKTPISCQATDVAPNSDDRDAEHRLKSLGQTLTLKLIDDGSGTNQLGVRVKRLRTTGLTGLLVKSILSGSLAEKDGQLLVNDRLTDVNGVSLIDLDKSLVVDLFRSTIGECLRNSSAVRVTVFRQHLLETPLPVPPPFESSVVKTSRHIPSSYTCLQVSSTSEGTETSSEGTGASEQSRSDEGRLLSSYGQDCFDCDDRVSEGDDDSMKTSSEKRSDEFLGCVDSFRRLESLPLSERRSENETKGSYEDIVTDIHGDRQLSTGSRTTKGESDDRSETETETETMILGLSFAIDNRFPQDEDTILDSDEIVFRRDGFGRRSISEKRSYQDFLSRSEIYRNIKENRKKKEITLHEEKPSIHVEPNVEDLLGRRKDSFDQTEDAASMKTICDSSSDVNQIKQTHSIHPAAGNSTEACTNSPEAPVSVTADEQNGSEASPSASRSCKASKRFNASAIRGFLKRGFSELFRSEKRADISRCSQGDTNTTDERQNIQSLHDDRQVARGSSLPRLASHCNARDVSVFSRFPSQRSYGQYCTNTLPTANAGIYLSRFHQMPPTRSSFPVHRFLHGSDPVASGLLGQNRFPLPPSRPVNLTRHGSFFYPRERLVMHPQQQHQQQQMMMMQCRTPSIRMFPVMPCQPSWSRPRFKQRVDNFIRLPSPEKMCVEQHSGRQCTE